MSASIPEVRRPREHVSLLLRALDTAQTAVMYQDPDLRYVWVENPPAGWTEADLIGRTDLEIVSGKSGEYIMEEKRKALKAGQQSSIHVEVEHEEAMRTFEVNMDPDIDQDGQTRGLLCVIQEITEKRRREISIQQLLLEVSHRSRNLLAIVKSLAAQTIRTSPSPQEFMRRFETRVQSIAHSLDVITVSEWDGATLHELVARQLAPFHESDADVPVSGLNPKLDANAAVHVGLALQELAASGTRDGAWRDAWDDVELIVRFADGQDDMHRTRRDVELVWKEQIDADHDDREPEEFALKTLQHIVPSALGGHADLDMKDDTLTYRLRIPQKNFR